MRKLPNKAAADDSGPHARTAAYSLSAPTPHRRSNRKRAQWYGRWGITDADKPNTDKDAAGGSRFDYSLGFKLLYMILYIGGGHTAGCAVPAFVCLQ